jgi:glycerol-3-phosphate acyltransferase PlsY
MKFKGGKGLACLGGVILMYSGKLFIVMLLLEFILAFVVDYICVVPMSASVAFSVIYGILDKDVFGMLLLLAVSVVIFMKHMDNLKRIRKGQEVHFSYLWNKEAEIERIKENGATEGK